MSSGERVIRALPRAIHWIFTAPVCGLISFFRPGWVGSVLVLATIALGVLMSQVGGHGGGRR